MRVYACTYYFFQHAQAYIHNICMHICTVHTLNLIIIKASIICHTATAADVQVQFNYI